MRFLRSIGQRTSQGAGGVKATASQHLSHLSKQVEREIAEAIERGGGYDKDNPFRGGFHRRWVPPKIPPGLELLGYDDKKLKELFQPFIEGQTVGRRQSGKPDEVFDNSIYGYKPGGPRATMTIRREPARVIMDTALWAQGPDGWFSTGRARLEFAAVQGIIVDKWGLTHTGWPSQRLQLACSTEFLSPQSPPEGSAALTPTWPPSTACTTSGTESAPWWRRPPKRTRKTESTILCGAV